MKHSHALKIRRVATFLCAAVLFCACSYERIPDDDGNGGKDGELATVTLKVGPAANEQNIPTKGLSDAQEKAINTLYILAFQPDDSGDYRLKYNATGKPGDGGDGQFSFILRRSLSGAPDTKLLLIANLNPYPLVNTGMIYSDVQTALTSVELGTAPAFADTGIPMFGFAGNSPDTPLEITGNMQPLSASLLRAIARVDVGVGTYNETNGEWNKGSVNFDLTEIYVFKPQNRYSLLPLANNLEYAAGGAPSVTAPSPAGAAATDGRFTYTGTAITNSTFCKSEIYIPEIAFNGGTVFDENHENRTALVIGGIYNGRTYYYRIDFTTLSGNVEGTALTDVLRNYIYRYSITNVSLPGYTAPEDAYRGKPVDLTFTASIVDWGTGTAGSPNPDMLVRMNFGGVNGTIVEGPAGEVLPKKDEFTTDGGRITPGLRYNSLLGEANDNTYNGLTNGGVYTNVRNAFTREGPYGKLIIAPDNAGEALQWRSTPKNGPIKDRVLDAKKACWDYRGQGRSDWRLPRLSELYLIWLNRATINQSKGFTSLGETDVAYWSASEGLDDKVYSVNAEGTITLSQKTDRFMVRCVRENR